MNATPRDQRIAAEIYAYLNEQSMGEPFNINNVMAILMAAVSQTGDESMHQHGDIFGGAYQELMAELNQTQGCDV